MELPRYFAVGRRLVRFTTTGDGGMDVEGWDFEARAFQRDMDMLTICLFGKNDAVEIDKAAFEARLTELQAE